MRVTGDYAETVSTAVTLESHVEVQGEWGDSLVRGCRWGCERSCRVGSAVPDFERLTESHPNDFVSLVGFAHLMIIAFLCSQAALTQENVLSHVS